MLVGHLLCGIIFGALVTVASLVVGFSLLGVLLTLIIGTNVGLGASVLLRQSFSTRSEGHEQPVKV
jgi:hypothetical protein